MARKEYGEKYTYPELREKLLEEIKQSDKGGEPGQWSARIKPNALRRSTRSRAAATKVRKMRARGALSGGPRRRAYLGRAGWTFHSDSCVPSSKR